MKEDFVKQNQNLEENCQGRRAEEEGGLPVNHEFTVVKVELGEPSDDVTLGKALEGNGRLTGIQEFTVKRVKEEHTDLIHENDGFVSGTDYGVTLGLGNQDFFTERRVVKDEEVEGQENQNSLGTTRSIQEEKESLLGSKENTGGIKKKKRGMSKVKMSQEAEEHTTRPVGEGKLGGVEGESGEVREENLTEFGDGSGAFTEKEEKGGGGGMKRGRNTNEEFVGDKGGQLPQKEVTLGRVVNLPGNQEVVTQKLVKCEENDQGGEINVTLSASTSILNKEVEGHEKQNSLGATDLIQEEKESLLISKENTGGKSRRKMKKRGRPKGCNKVKMSQEAEGKEQVISDVLKKETPGELAYEDGGNINLEGTENVINMRQVGDGKLGGAEGESGKVRVEYMIEFGESSGAFTKKEEKGGGGGMEKGSNANEYVGDKGGQMPQKEGERLVGKRKSVQKSLENKQKMLMIEKELDEWSEEERKRKTNKSRCLKGKKKADDGEKSGAGLAADERGSRVGKKRVRGKKSNGRENENCESEGDALMEKDEEAPENKKRSKEASETVECREREIEKGEHVNKRYSTRSKKTEKEAVLNSSQKKKYDENVNLIESDMCHQCQRNDKGRVVRCSKCTTKRYCLPCMNRWYPGRPEKAFVEACPVCCQCCNCKACLGFDMSAKLQVNVKQRPNKSPTPSSSDSGYDENPFEDDRFNTQEELDCWKEHWATRKCNPERVFKVDTFSDEVQQVANAIIKRRKWERIIQTPREYNLTLVREFYAIASQLDGSSTQLRIRGRLVNFSESAINKYYHLNDTNPSYREFEHQKKSAEYAEEARLLLFSHIPKPVKYPYQIKSVDLTMPFRFWHRFINFNLLPSTNTSELAQERYSLIYKIASDKGLNVGEFIFKQIRKIAASKTLARGTKIFGFPCLITNLCLEAGVEIEDRDERIASKAFAVESIQEEQQPTRGEASTSHAQADGPSVDLPPPSFDAPLPSDGRGPSEDMLFTMTRNAQYHYGMASALWDLMSSNNRLRDTMDRHFGANTPPFTFNYHGYPFGSFYNQHPESFSATSTDYIPEYARPFTGRSAPIVPPPPFPQMPGQFDASSS